MRSDGLLPFTPDVRSQGTSERFREVLSDAGSQDRISRHQERDEVNRGKSKSSLPQEKPVRKTGSPQEAITPPAKESSPVEIPQNVPNSFNNPGAMSPREDLSENVKEQLIDPPGSTGPGVPADGSFQFSMLTQGGEDTAAAGVFFAGAESGQGTADAGESLPGMQGLPDVQAPGQKGLTQEVAEATPTAGETVMPQNADDSESIIIQVESSDAVPEMPSPPVRNDHHTVDAGESLPGTQGLHEALLPGQKLGPAKEHAEALPAAAETVVPQNADDTQGEMQAGGDASSKRITGPHDAGQSTTRKNDMQDATSYGLPSGASGETENTLAGAEHSTSGMHETTPEISSSGTGLPGETDKHEPESHGTSGETLPEGSPRDIPGPAPGRSAAADHMERASFARHAGERARVVHADGYEFHLVRRGESSVEVSIRPEGLGKVDISLVLERGVISANIQTSDQQTRDLIERNIAGILNALRDDGIAVSDFTVTYQEGNKGMEYRSMRYGTAAGMPQTGNDTAVPLRTRSGMVSIFV